MNNKSDSTVKSTEKKGLQWNWLVWCMPLVAIGLAAWFVYKALPQPAESIVVVTDKAGGINANNTFVFHRGVQIGRVTAVELTEDLNSIELSIDLNEGREIFAREGARYWVVRPELNNASIQGFSTIVSGPEIHAKAGSGKSRMTFEALAENPLPNMGENDLLFKIRSAGKSGISRGSKVVYRGIQVGLVADVRLSELSNYVLSTINVFEQYAPLVRDNTVFWNSGGINVDFGLFRGADVDINSLSSILSGEISFATPDEIGDQIQPGHQFDLQSEADEAWLAWEPEFSGSL